MTRSLQKKCALLCKARRGSQIVGPSPSNAPFNPQNASCITHTPRGKGLARRIVRDDGRAFTGSNPRRDIVQKKSKDYAEVKTIMLTQLLWS